MWIKICANTNAEDALAAARLGADAVGFVFAPSKRQVTASAVRAIAEHLPDGMQRIGVVSGATVPEIVALVEQAKLTGVQLHEGVGNDAFAELRAALAPEITIIQTVHWKLEDDAGSEVRVRGQLDAAEAERVLVDAKLGSASGGLGVSFDWAAARPVLSCRPEIKMIVAGGLRPENVAEAIRQLQPWGVDVASGVEAAPGRKDLGRLRAFIENARGVKA